MNRKWLAFFMVFVGALFLVFPNNVFHGAKMGLLLWFQTVLPALLPFMVFSDFMMKENITGYISNMVYPFFSKVFSISRKGSYAAVMGLLSGYPLGAKTTADLYRRKEISKREAQYLLTFCNNASPMFLLEYMGIGCMGAKNPLAVLGIIYLSALGSAVLSGLRPKRKDFSQKECSLCEKEKKLGVIQALDESILDSFITITKVGGYIILFSILAKIVEDVFPSVWEIKKVSVGILEITTGGQMMKNASMNREVRNILLLGLSAFGGLSSVAQTASVLNGTDLSVGKYMMAKGRQAVIAMVLGYGMYCL